MSEQKRAFLLGAKNKNISEDKANEIFDQISAFAGYGFNKSHAAAYALIAYQCAWLKVHHSHEFFASLMTYDTDNVDKLSIFANELNRMKIKIIIVDDMAPVLPNSNVVTKALGISATIPEKIINEIPLPIPL